MTEPHPNHRNPATLPPELRSPEVPAHVRRWVESYVGVDVVDATAFDGASSAAVHRLDLADETSVVLRRYAWPGFLEADPDAPGREVEAIRFAGDAGLPVAGVIAADPTGAEVGDDVPVVLTTLLTGAPVRVPDLEALAEAAMTVHAVDPSGFDHAYFPWCRQEMMAPPPGTTDPALWERALELWHAGPPRRDEVFVHRDFHPGNLLWTDGALTGIVDWANACAGPSGCDIAHCRANLRDLAGPDVADRFVAIHTSITGADLDPYWVLAGHLEHSPDHWTPERLASDEPDLERAVHAVG